MLNKTIDECNNNIEILHLQFVTFFVFTTGVEDITDKIWYTDK